MQSTDRGVRLPAAALPGSNPGQGVHTHVPSASEVTTVLRYRKSADLIEFILQCFYIIMWVTGCIMSLAPAILRPLQTHGGPGITFTVISGKYPAKQKPKVDMPNMFRNYLPVLII